MATLSAPAGARVLEVDGARVWLAGGILHQQITVARIEVEHVVAVIDASLQLQGDRGSTPVLIDIRAVRWASAEARARGAADATRFLSKASALLVGSPVSRMVGSLFVRMSRPPYPLRLFDVLRDALAWLEAHDE